ncbi:hypothetical protein ACLOJK_040157 [Asimina triloba]
MAPTCRALPFLSFTFPAAVFSVPSDLEAGAMSDHSKPSQKIVAIAAGETHTLALTGDGSVYSWGRGAFGRLGTGKESDELAPVRLGFDGSLKMETVSIEDGSRARPRFVQVAAGAYHSLALEGGYLDFNIGSFLKRPIVGDSPAWALSLGSCLGSSMG